jgi:hypothetical protein
VRFPLWLLLTLERLLFRLLEWLLLRWQARRGR